MCTTGIDKSRFLPHDAMPPLDGPCDQQSVGMSGETGQSSRTGLEHRRDDLSHLRGNKVYSISTILAEYHEPIELRM